MIAASMDLCAYGPVVQEDQRESTARKTGLGNSPVVIRKLCCEERGLRTSEDLNLVDQYQRDTQPSTYLQHS